jgi:hypothetical protein
LMSALHVARPSLPLGYLSSERDVAALVREHLLREIRIGNVWPLPRVRGSAATSFREL